MANYKCPRCGSTETYKSEENGRTFALTLDTPSPVDPTIFHTMKHEIVRCKKCGEKAELDRWNYTVPKHTPEEWLEITESNWRSKRVKFRLLMSLCWFGILVYGGLTAIVLFAALRDFPDLTPAHFTFVALFGISLLLCVIFLRRFKTGLQDARDTRDSRKERFLEEIEREKGYREALSKSEGDTANSDTEL